MALYNYKCKKCHHSFEVSHSIKERLTDCSKCNSGDVLERIPPKNTIAMMPQENKSSNEQPEVGSVVKETIIEERRAIEEEKREWSSKVWAPK